MLSLEGALSRLLFAGSILEVGLVDGCTVELFTVSPSRRDLMFCSNLVGYFVDAASSSVAGVTLLE